MLMNNQRNIYTNPFTPISRIWMNNQRNIYTNPFTSISSIWMPQNMEEVFTLVESIYRLNGIFRAAIDRTANLFMTQFVFTKDEATEDQKIIKEYLNKKFKKTLISIGIDYLIYGNSFLLTYLPFTRFLICPHCNQKYKIDKLEKVTYNGSSFSAQCPSCVRITPMQHLDIKITDINKVNIIRIPPKEIEIQHNRFSGNSIYYWKLDSLDISRIKANEWLAETPIEIIDCAYKDLKLKLNNNELLHIAQNNLAGKNLEWGIPFGVSCFPLVFYINILRKANEAISADYIIPLRILFPQNNTASQEAIYMNSAEVVGKIQNIIETHREDPNAYYTTPGPIGYQVIGGEKRSLMISEDLKMSTDELLNACGWPVEFFYGTLGLQATPMALRLLENTFGLTDVYNTILTWLLNSICPYFNLTVPEVELLSIRWVDDMEKRNFVLQLASADKISEMTLLEMYGISYEDEQTKKIRQMQILEKIQNDAKQTKERNTQNQQGGSVGTTPVDIQEQAQQIAEQLYTLPEGQRRSELYNLNQTNQVLHDSVMGALNRIDNKSRTQGRNMIREQMGG